MALVARATQAMVSGMKDLVASQVAAGDEVQKMAQRVNFTTETLSEMSLALKLAGSEMGAMEVAMRGVHQMVDGANDGLSTATGTISKLGMSLEQLNKMNSEEKFFAIAEALSAIEDGGARAAVAQEAFGRGASAIMPLINSNIDGARELARQQGNVWTQAQADTAAKLNDMYTLIAEAMSGLGKTLALQLMPHLSRFFAGVAAFIPTLTEWVQRTDYAGQAIQWLASTWSEFWNAVKVFGTAIVNTFDSVLRGGVAMAYGIAKSVTEMRVAVLEEVTNLANSIASRLPDNFLGKAIARQLGIDPDLIRDIALEYQTSLDQAKSDLNALLSNGIVDDSTLTGIRAGLENIVGGTFESVGSMVLTATAGLGQYFDDADGRFSQMMSVFRSGTKTMEKDQKKSFKAMGKVQEQFRSQAVDAFLDIVGGASKSFSEILKSLLSAIGRMMVHEGMSHVIAGQAMMHAPGLEAQGAARRRAGTKMIAWGVAATALGGALGSGGDSGGDSSSGSTSSDVATDRTGPGYDYRDEEDERGKTQIIVQGSLYDSRETWARMAELSREFADDNIVISRAAVG